MSDVPGPRRSGQPQRVPDDPRKIQTVKLPTVIASMTIAMATKTLASTRTTQIGIMAAQRKMISPTRISTPNWVRVASPPTLSWTT